MSKSRYQRQHSISGIVIVGADGRTLDTGNVASKELGVVPVQVPQESSRAKTAH